MTRTELPALVAALQTALPDGTVLTDGPDLDRYAHDDAEWADWAPPAAVVLATGLDDVVATVRAAAEHGAPVVPRGAGTGLSGGANAVAGAVVLSLERMTRIREVNVDERYAVVEAGVLNDDLRRHVAAHGLWYPPDPASQAISTIGGNVATNAGGLCCVKYGVTRDYVLGMTVVLADGSVARLGRTTAKGVTGYDLTGLMVGSEGTLGVVVDVTLKLRPLAGREDRAVVGWFGSLPDAGNAVAAVSAAGIVPAALELIDSTCLRAVADWQGWTLPEGAAALLLAKVDEPGAAGEALADRVAALFEGRAARTSSAPSHRTRPTGCSSHDASPTPRWSGSAPCSRRTSACPAARFPRCSAASRASRARPTS
nr:hypothetical protein GCM10025730_51430 [Promicromonospora thailandica]